MGTKLTTNEFIEKATLLHGEQYTYDKVNYINSRTSVVVTCNRCNMSFSIRANDHLQGKGCRDCNTKAFSTRITRPFSDFVAEASTVHSNAYSYNLKTYVNMSTKTDIYCRACRTSFSQLPSHHIKGIGCPQCAKYARAEKLRSTTHEFTEKANLKHKGLYDYSLVNYTTNTEKVTIICTVCETSFTQRPSAHLSGQGCPKCSCTGFDYTKSAILYYLEINNGQAYKIGITNHSINERFTAKELASIKVLATWDYQNGHDCYISEQKIIKEFKENQYKGAALLLSGNTELFDHDILAGQY